MLAILQSIEAGEYTRLVEILLDAETDEERLRQQLALQEHTSYFAMLEGEVVGAVTIKWGANESELVYIATVEQKRGKGYGKAMINAVFEQMRTRVCRSMLVGTGNTSLDNIAFYQKCGFRMDHVRRDFFAYAQPPLWENGILLRDMLVFRYTDLAVSGMSSTE